MEVGTRTISLSSTISVQQGVLIRWFLEITLGITLRCSLSRYTQGLISQQSDSKFSCWVYKSTLASSFYEVKKPRAYSQ